MSKEIENVDDFVGAALIEFWFDHPDIYGQFCYHLGSRVDEVQKGDLSESDYVAKWKDRRPEEEIKL